MIWEYIPKRITKYVDIYGNVHDKKPKSSYPLPWIHVYEEIEVEVFYDPITKIKKEYTYKINPITK